MIHAHLLTPTMTLREQIDFDTLTYEPKLNDVGTWSLTSSADDEKLRRAEKTWGIVLYDSDLPTGSDPIGSGKITALARSDADGTGTRTISGPDHMGILAQYVTYPNPAVPADAQTTARYEATGPAETIIRNLIRANAGQNALPERHPRLHVTASQGRGRTVKVSTRFENLLEVIQPIAALAEMRVSIVYRAGRLEVDVKPMRDRSNAMYFTEDSTSLGDNDYALSAPTTTLALVGGQGEGAARQITTVPAPAGAVSAWGEYAEVFIDQRDTDDPDKLIQSGEEELAAAAETASVSFTLTEDERRYYGRTIHLGDKVTIALDDGDIVDRVYGVKLTEDAAGRQVDIDVGQDAADSRDDPLVTAVNRLASKIRKTGAR